MLESHRFRLLAYGTVPIGLGGVTRDASHSSLVEQQRSSESGKLRAKFQSAPMVPTRSSAPLEVSSVRCRCEVNLCIPAKLPEDQIRVSERHRGPFWGSKFALPSCSGDVWLVSRAVAPAIAAAVQQHAMKMATGILQHCANKADKRGTTCQGTMLLVQITLFLPRTGEKLQCHFSPPSWCVHVWGLTLVGLY